MKKFAVLIATSAVMAAQNVIAAPPLTAVLTHEIVEHGADGVTRSTRYQEQFIRNEDRVWIERVLPTKALKKTSSKKAQSDAEHDELNVHLAPRLIRAADQGAAQLTLVDEEKHETYTVGTEDYERVGFSGRWAAEQSLIDPTTLRQMHKLSRSAVPAGATWYEQENANEYTRILWSEQLQFPLAIETGVQSGRYSSRTLVQLSKAHNAPMPWRNLAEFRQRELSDLGD